METTEETIYVLYQTQDERRGNPVDKWSSPSEIKGFSFDTKTILEWIEDGNEKEEEESEEEWEERIHDFMRETIHFFAAGFEQKVVLKMEEVEKVKQFCLAHSQ